MVLSNYVDGVNISALSWFYSHTHQKQDRVTFDDSIALLISLIKNLMSRLPLSLPWDDISFSSIVMNLKYLLGCAGRFSISNSNLFDP